MKSFFYLYQVLDILHGVSITFFAVAILLTIVGLICVLCYFDDEEFYKCSKKACKLGAVILLVSGLMMIFVPSGKTYALMQGGDIIEKTIQDNPEAKEIPSKTIQLVNDYLEKLIEENNE